MRGTTTWLAVGACLLLGAIVGGCGGNNSGEAAACAALMCDERQRCSTSTSPARCVCKDEYAGAGCTSCARGYMPVAGGGCAAPQVDCDVNPGICGSRGTCVQSAGLDLCQCATGYTGLVCQTCAEGYQDNDGDGRCTVSCVSMACQGLQTCTDSTGTARCGCSGGRIGTYCEQCPSGWVLRDNVCVQTCATSGTTCGSKKTCDPVQGVCVCRPEYGGDLCNTCSAGYQDKNNDGVCSASCEMTTCSPGQTCSDATGTAKCACPPNRTGAACEACVSGWVMRPSDGMCVQTCAALSCGTHRTCDETSGTPTCVCQAGYAGTDCASCAPGYLSDGAGQCVRTAPAGTTLLGAGRRDGTDYLLAINPTDKTATPLRPLTGLSGQRLATDLPGRIIYTVTSSAISRLDATTGKLTALAAVQSTATLCHGGGALFTFGQSLPNLLKRIDPATGGVSDIGATNLSSSSGSTGLTWESGGTLLFARPPTTAANGAELFRINPTNAAVTMLGGLTIDGMRLRPSDTRVGLAFDATGALFLATHLGRSPEEILTDHCRKLAVGLGLDGYADAPVTTLDISYNGIGAGLTRSLTSKQPSGPEIVAYASYGRRTSAKATLRIDTTNPGAFVCLNTYEEVLELQLTPATARFSGIVLTGNRPILTLVVDGTVPPVTRPTLHVNAPSGTIAPAFNGATGGYQFSKVYSSADWTALRLPTQVSVWDSDSAAPSVLLELDLGTRTVKRVLSFTATELYPTIAPWAP